MRILNLIQCLNLGGMEQALYVLMRETQGRAIDWQVQSVTPSGLGREVVEQLRIPVTDNSYEGKFGYKSHAALKEKVQGFSGDLILITGPTLTGCLSVRQNPQKKILGFHFCHQGGLLNRLKWKTFYTYFGHDYDAIVYYSPFSLQEAKQIAPWLQDKFHLIELSIKRCQATTAAERASSRRVLNIPENALVIGNAGWLIERKRFDVFLQVCAKLRDYIDQPLYFLIAGDGSLRAALEAQAHKLGIAEQTRFLGWQKDLNHFYQSLNLLLFNSNSDAFGLTVLEAMGYGIPVVASVVEGGTDCILTHQNNGFLIQKHDVDQLVVYCSQLIEDEELYQQFQLRSLDMLRTRFSPEKFIQSHVDLFEKVMSSQASAKF